MHAFSYIIFMRFLRLFHVFLSRLLIDVLRYCNIADLVAVDRSVH